jgi:hypothetical protein
VAKDLNELQVSHVLVGQKFEKLAEEKDYASSLIAGMRDENNELYDRFGLLEKA